MSMANSCFIYFSWSSVMEVHMFAKDMFRPREPFERMAELSALWGRGG